LLFLCHYRDDYLPLQISGKNQGSDRWCQRFFARKRRAEPQARIAAANARDAEKINRFADELNPEMQDVLACQSL
jgi:hypothetical protein